MSNPTLGLSMIIKSPELADPIIEKYGKYFDKFFITVASKTKPKKLPEGYTWFKWCDNFGKARQFNQDQIDTDFWFWCDADDEIVNPELIPDMLNLMEIQQLDAIHLLYDYMHNDIGESVSPHWRERMIRTDSMLRWSDSRCHETLLAPNAKALRYDNCVIKHVKTQAEHEASQKRNIELLIKDFEDTKDPRTAMYLGDNLMYLKQYDDALFFLKFLIENGGWDEDKYRAWLKISEIKFLLGDYERAVDACNAAEHLMPDFPDAYFQKASIYNAMNLPAKVYEWVKVGMSKPIPNTMSPYDPTLYEYRGIFMGALSALELGRVDEAYELFSIVRKRSPNYQLAKDMEPIFTEAKEDTEAIKRLKWLLYYAKDRGADVGRILNTLPQKLVADPRLNVERAKLLPTRKWPAKSVVFYCGPATEPWGPDKLESGAGGSEEAVIYLSRELAKLGWDVTVFNDREEEIYDCWNPTDNPEYGQKWFQTNEQTGGERGGYLNYPKKVHYQPWTMLNPFDEFDVFVAWRHANNALNVKARVLAVDLHDTPTGHVALNSEHIKQIDKFFLKSDFQWQLSDTPISGDKPVIVGNGILPEQFAPLDGHKRKYDIGYFSSADRGLDVLLQLIPRIEEKLGRKVTSCWAYGWNTFDQFHSQNPVKMKWKWQQIKAMNEVGMDAKGRLSHEELAKLMADTDVWAYPTSFQEIHCITALKAQASGCRPVTSGFAALQETVFYDEEEIGDLDLRPDKIEEFVDRVVKTLQTPRDEKALQAKADEVKAKTSWTEVAKVWDKELQ